MPANPPVRFAKALAYDARILDASLAVLAEEGWSGFTARRVAQRAGVSQQAVQDRYPDRSAMAQGAWRNGAAAPLEESLEALLTAHGTLASDVDDAAARAAWRPFMLPDPSLRAGLELLFASPFDDALHATVHETLGTTVIALTSHDDRTATRRLATQRAYLIGRALGLTMIGCIADLAHTDMRWMEDAILGALAHPARMGQRTEPPPLPFTLANARLATGHARRDALMNAALQIVAERGFHDATLQSIAEAAGTSKGVALSYYPTKQALFIAAAQLRAVEAQRRNMAFLVELNARLGAGRSEAAFLRAALHPDLAQDRNLLREEYRLRIHDATLREEHRRSYLGLLGLHDGADPKLLGHAFGVAATGEGIALLLTLLAPDAWRLPFDVVIVALGEQLAWMQAASNPAPDPA